MNLTPRFLPTGEWIFASILSAEYADVMLKHLEKRR